MTFQVGDLVEVISGFDFQEDSLEIGGLWRVDRLEHSSLQNRNIVVCTFIDYGPSGESSWEIGEDNAYFFDRNFKLAKKRERVKKGYAKWIDGLATA